MTGGAYTRPGGTHMTGGHTHDQGGHTHDLGAHTQSGGTYMTRGHTHDRGITHDRGGHTHDRGAHTRPGHLPVLPPPCLRDESKCSFHGILDDGLETEGQSPSAGVSSTARSGAPSSSASSPRPRPSSHNCTPNKVAVLFLGRAGGGGEKGSRRLSGGLTRQG